MSANKLKQNCQEELRYEISTIGRQSRIKTACSRGDNKIRYRSDRPGKKEKPQEAEVIAVGPGGVIDGKEVKMEVAAGQTVIYSKYAGTEVKLEGEEYIIVRQSDILAVVE